MFIVMNRFNIRAGMEETFEDGWKGRETNLERFAGFRSFALLRNPRPGENGTSEFISQTTWATRADFETWRASPEFSAAHSQGGSMAEVLAGPPQVSVYDAVIEESNSQVTG